MLLPLKVRLDAAQSVFVKYGDADVLFFEGDSTYYSVLRTSLSSFNEKDVAYLYFLGWTWEDKMECWVLKKDSL